MRRLGSSAVHYGLIFALLALTLFPFYMLLTNSLKHAAQMIHNFWGISLPLRFDNYVTAFDQIGPFLLNTIIISCSIVVGVLVVSSLAAYSFSRFQFPGDKLLFTLILSLMMIPSYLILIPQFLLVRELGMLNTYQGQIFPAMAFGASMATFLMKAFFDGLPRSLLEAADMEGAGEVQIFTRIVLPLSLPIMSTVAIINFLNGWNNYIWPLVSTSGDKVKPVILALSTITGSMDQGRGVQLAGYIIASLPLLALFLVATKPFISGVTAGAVKG